MAEESLLPRQTILKTASRVPKTRLCFLRGQIGQNDSSTVDLDLFTTPQALWNGSLSGQSSTERVTSLALQFG